MRSRRRGAGPGKAERLSHNSSEKRGFPWQDPEAPLLRPGQRMSSRPWRTSPQYVALPASCRGPPLRVVHSHGRYPSPRARGQGVCAAALGKGLRTYPGNQQRTHWALRCSFCQGSGAGSRAEGRRANGKVWQGPDLGGPALTSPSLSRTQSQEPPTAPGARRHTKLPVHSLGWLPACLCSEDQEETVPSHECVRCWLQRECLISLPLVSPHPPYH